MSLRPMSYPEVLGGYGNTGLSFISMQSSRVDPTGFQTLSGINLTYLDFNTAAYSPRIFVIYCPYGGWCPQPSEPISYQPGVVANYAHRLESIYDSSVGQTGGPGYWEPGHFAPGWHVFVENWDPVLDFGNYRAFLYNIHDDPTGWVDYAIAYISPMNVNNGQTVQLSGSNQQSGVRVVQPPIQGLNGRTDTSPGGASNEAGGTSVTHGVQNDTTFSREYFFMANFLFDPSGQNPSPNYNPQLGIHNVVSAVTPAFTHALTVKPRYLNGADFEPNSSLWGQPMPHGVVMSCWFRDIYDIGPAPHRERTISPIQATYNSTSLSLVVKGGNFGPAHVQAF